MKLQLSRHRGLIKIDKRNDDGDIVARFSSTFGNDDHFKKGATTLGLTADVLMFYVDKFEKGKDATAEFVLSINPIDNFTLSIRAIEDTEDKCIYCNGTTPLDVFKESLSNSTLPSDSQPIIYWKDKKHLAAVDLDVKPGTILDLTTLLAGFNPCPSMAWITHGGGLRLIYVSQDIFTAEELAALAIYTLSFMLEYTNLELKSSTRHPYYKKDEQVCGDVIQYVQTTEITELMKFLRRFTVDDKEVFDWLSQYDYVKGERYPHSRCPVDPSDTGKTDCVLIGEKGIKCYICEAHGTCYGSHKPGFFPYATFIKSSESTLLYKCVRNFSHYSHAKYILTSRFGIQGNFQQLAYSGLLKSINNVYDGRITDALYRGSNFIRIDNQWMTESGDVYNKDLKPLLSTLPACQILKRNGTIIIDNEKLTKFQQTHDLTEYGYPSLTPIWGHKIGSYYLEGELNNKIFATIQRSIFNGQRHLSPKYMKGDVDNAWRIFDAVFPGINHNLIYLLISARGCMELEYGLPPFIFITGPTSSGKTASIELASGIIGDNVSSIVWVNNIERVREAIGTEKHNGSFIAFNEMIKESKSKRQNPANALDFLLNLTRNSSSHQLYIGPVKMGTLPVICFTDTDLPVEIKTDKQLSRRIVHIHLPSQVDWLTSIRQHGLSSIPDLRLISQKVADACNIIMSHIIDTYFGSPLTFFDIVELIGLSTLSNNEESMDMDNMLRQLYTKICSAPPLSGSDAIRWSGRGWKVISKNEVKSELVCTWLEICDPSELGFTTSRRCEEVDWQKIIDAVEPCRIEIRAHGNTKIAIRFRSVDGNKQDYKVNEQLTKKGGTNAGKKG